MSPRRSSSPTLIRRPPRSSMLLADHRPIGGMNRSGHTSIHNVIMDEEGKVWFTERLRPPQNPDYCKQGSSHPSAKADPQATSVRQLSRFDPATGKWDLINTCFSTHHLYF